jgi:hypothetical protein
VDEHALRGPLAGPPLALLVATRSVTPWAPVAPVAHRYLARPPNCSKTAALAGRPVVCDLRPRGLLYGVLAADWADVDEGGPDHWALETAGAETAAACTVAAIFTVPLPPYTLEAR